MSQDPNSSALADSESLGGLELVLPLMARWKLLILGPIVAGLLALGATYLMPKVYTSRTVFLPPQQQQSAAAAAIAQLGPLSGLAGAAAGIKSPAEQYVSLLQSNAVVDRLIDRFDLMRVYRVDFRFQAREELAARVRIQLGKKDGLITIEVEDVVPARAAEIANRHVEELRHLTSQLSLTEAQQRRAFLETQLAQTKDRLTRAQQALQASGFSEGALKTDARAAAEGYAQLRAEIASGEVRLQTLRGSLADTTSEVQQAASTLRALRAQLARLESTKDFSGAPDYVGKFREFKFQEALFEMFARQFELARLDESREGALIQVVDRASPAEWKSRPKRALIAASITLATFLLIVVAVLMRHHWARAMRGPGGEKHWASVRAAVAGRL